MESEKQSRFMIACRYVPYDQWFLTHIHPSWKIKHVKQIVLAKALNLPFDRRALALDPSLVRPTSPITFAPVENTLLDSPIDSDPLDLGDRESLDLGRRSNLHESGPAPGVAFPCQILEDEFLVSWYNLVPRELVELHCSTPPSTFSHSLVFGQLLLNEGSITVHLPDSNSDRSGLTSSGPQQPQGSVSSQILDSSFSGASKNKKNLREVTLHLPVSDAPTLVSLPRHDPISYAQPYWEGWVRILRGVYGDSGSGSRFPDTTSGSAILETGVTPEMNRKWKGDHGQNGRWPKRAEWRERWAVIRDGVLNICKDRNDPNASHRLPLSSLISICGAEYLSHTGPSGQPGTSTRRGGSNRPTSSHSTVTTSTMTKAADDWEARTIVNAPSTVPSAGKPLSTPKVLSPLLTSVTASEPVSPVSAYYPPVSGYGLPSAYTERSRREHEKLDRQRAVARELERDRFQKEQQEKAQLDKHVEYIIRWDDIGLGFGKSRARTSKDKRHRNEKDREDRKQKIIGSPVLGGSLNPFMADRDKEERDRDRQREKERERHEKGRERERQRDKEREKSDRQREREFRASDDRYVPSSQEEALANGLRVVCTKFRITSRGDETPTSRKTTFLSRDSDVPSVISETEESDGKDSWDREKERKRLDRERHPPTQPSENSWALPSLPAPRKASLPGLGLGFTMLNSGSNTGPSSSSSNLFGGFFSAKDKEKDNADRAHRTREKEDARTKLMITTGRVPNALASPVFGRNPDWEELIERERENRGFDHSSPEWKTKGRGEDKAEWIVLDLVTDVAYDAFLRILHRHFPPPMKSSFIDTHSARLEPSDPNYFEASVDPPYGMALALPYPEWRHEVVNRARSEGSLESGRPMELVLFNGDTKPNPNLQNDQRKVDAAAHKEKLKWLARENEDDNTDPIDSNTALALVFDDSDDGNESEDEPSLWLGDIPRQQTLKEKSRRTVEAQKLKPREPESEMEENAQESPTSPNMPFADPFAFSPPAGPMPSSTTLTSVEDRLRPSVSSTTLASNATSSSVSSMAFNNAPTGTLRHTTRSFTSSSGTRSTGSPTGVSWHTSPEHYQFPAHPRRIVSPSHTLSSPSSSESLASFSYQQGRFPPRPFSPASDSHQPNLGYHHQRKPEPTAHLHHSVSMPNTTLERMSTTTPFANFEKPILTPAQIHQIEAEVDAQMASTSIYGTFGAGGEKQIFSPVRVQQIEYENDNPTDFAGSGPDSYSKSVPSPMTSGTGASTRSSSFGNSSELEPLQESGDSERGQASDVQDTGNIDREDELPHRNNSGPRRFVNMAATTATSQTYGPTTTSRMTAQDQRRVYNTSSSPRSGPNSASASAKAILRRVRSGSSLQTPMGVHFEELEEDGGVITHGKQFVYSGNSLVELNHDSETKAKVLS